MDKYFKDKNISKKLSSAFRGILILFIVAIVFGIVGVGMMSVEMTRFYNQPYRNNVQMMEIRKDMQYIGKQLLWAVAEQEPEEMQKHMDEVIAYGERINKNVEDVKKNSTNPEKVGEMQELLAELGELRQQIGDLTIAGNNAEAMQIYNTDYAALVEQIQDMLVKFSTRADENAQSMYNTTWTVGMIEVIAMVVLGVLGCVLGVKLSRSITKSITDPISELETAAQKLGSGELNIEIQYNGKDEFGILSDNFRKLPATICRR